MMVHAHSYSCSGVGVGGEGGANAPPKVFICRKPGKNSWKFGTRCFETFKRGWMFKSVWILLFSPKNGDRWDKLKTSFFLGGNTINTFVILFCIGEIRASFAHCIPNMKTFFLVFMFLREKFVGWILGAQIFFRQLWGYSGKIPSHPQKFACSYALLQDQSTQSPSEWFTRCSLLTSFPLHFCILGCSLPSCVQKRNPGNYVPVEKKWWCWKKCWRNK